MDEPLKGKQLVVRRGAAISLECKANGNPSPVVTWVKVTRKDHGVRGHHLRKITGKELTNNGMILTLNDVGRKDAGKYR